MKAKLISLMIILLFVSNFIYPVLASSNNTQDDNEENIEFETYISSYNEDGTIDSYGFDKQLKIENGGLLTILIKVKDSGYIKDSTIRLDSPNFLLSDKYDVEVNKITSTSEEQTSASNVDNTLAEEAKTDTESSEYEIKSSGVESLSYGTTTQMIAQAEQTEKISEVEDGKPINNSISNINNDNNRKNESTDNKDSSIVNDIFDSNGKNIVKSIKDNTITLNQITSNRLVFISIPISFEKNTITTSEYFNKNTNISFNAKYVKEEKENKEKEITRTKSINVSWTTKVETAINQQIVRFIKYEDNKALLSMKIFDEVINDKLPYLTKNYEVKVPSINNNLPKSAIIVSKNVSYSIEGDILKIERKNDTSKGKVNTETSDATIITYLFEMDDIPTDINVSSDVYESIELIDGQSVKNIIENSNYTANGETGKIVDMTLSAPAELSKGFMYSNLDKIDNKFDTDFYEILTIDIGFKDLIDKVVLSQDNTDTSLLTKKVQIDPEDFLNVLGEDGYIKVIDIDGNQIATIDIRNLEMNIYTDKSIRFETSRPISEGSFPILITRAISSNLPFTREEIKQIPSLTDNLTVKSYMQDNEVSSGTINLKIGLTEPVSKASIEISHPNLSTIDVNKDVEITATLETDSIDDALFKDPSLTFTLPDAVKSINVKDAKLVFDEELVPTEYTANGNVINVKLSGTQTKYSTLAISKGTKVKIIADLTLDSLATSSFNSVNLTYSNANTRETNSVLTSTNVIAPEDFIITNETTITPKGEEKISLLAREATNQEYKFKGYLGKEQSVNVSGTIVNNLGYDATNVKILGRTFNSDTLKTDQSNENFDSSFDTTLNGPISVNGLGNYRVYYSQNGHASQDLNDTNNGWSTDYNVNSKSYLIVSEESVPFGRKITFNYISNVSKDVDYDKQATQMFSVYYTSKQSMLKNSATCKMYTNTKPIIDINITAKNYYTGEELYQDSVVNYGDIVQFSVNIKNNSNGTVFGTNGKLSFDDRLGAAFISSNWNGKDNAARYTIVNNEMSTEIGTLNQGETKSTQFNVFIGNDIAPNSKISLRCIINAEDMEEEAANSFSLVGGDGVIVSKLTISGNEKTSYNVGDEINVEAIVQNQMKATVTDLKDCTVTMQLPESIEFSSGDNIEYNKRKNILTFDVSEIINTESRYIPFSFKLKVKESKVESSNELIINSSYKYSKDGNDVDANTTSNKLKIITGSSNKVDVSFECSVNDKEITEDKEIIYYIKIKNNSEDAININIEDAIPEQLTVYSIICDSNSNIINLDAKNDFSYSARLEKDYRLNITIKTKTTKLYEDYDIENSPKIRINDNLINTNSIKHKVKLGTSKEENLKVNSSINLTKNSILGLAWEDENGDGIRQDNEKLLEGISFELYDRLTNQIARDANFVEIKATSDSEGRYELNNVPNGNYYIVAKYDNSKYKISRYDVNTSASTNSDFINSTFNEDAVAATNIISLDSNNQYNVDLGLDSNNVFDLSLDLSISKVTVTNSNKPTEEKEYDKVKILKHEFEPNRVDNDTVIIEYTIAVKNEGKVPGYATTIADFIPDEMTFNSELNKDWVLIDDVAYNKSLINTLINPGESKELKIVLTKKMDGESVGLVHNIAEIVSDYNERAIADIDSTPNNYDSSEDDLSSADIYLGITTGIKILYKYALVIIAVGIIIYIIIMTISEKGSNKRSKIKKWRKA